MSEQTQVRRTEPLDPKVRRLAGMAYLVVTLEHLGETPDEEADLFELARRLHHLTTTPAPVDPAADEQEA